MQALYLHIAFVCESIPEDGEMSIKDLLGKINVEGDTEKMVPYYIAVSYSFSSVENILGSSTAANTLTGDNNNNLTGGAEADSIDGGKVEVLILSLLVVKARILLFVQGWLLLAMTVVLKECQVLQGLRILPVAPTLLTIPTA